LSQEFRSSGVAGVQEYATGKRVKILKKVALDGPRRFREVVL
jgi:hypothetical protein